MSNVQCFSFFTIVRQHYFMMNFGGYPMVSQCLRMFITVDHNGRAYSVNMLMNNWCLHVAFNHYVASFLLWSLYQSW